MYHLDKQKSHAVIIDFKNFFYCNSILNNILIDTNNNKNKLKLISTIIWHALLKKDRLLRNNAVTYKKK